jgi:hypothetical protein
MARTSPRHRDVRGRFYGGRTIDPEEEAVVESSDDAPEVVSFLPPVAIGDSASAPPQMGSNVQRGHRPVKEYYLYDGDFRELKKAGAVATVLFAVGSACAGYALNVHLGLAFAENLPDAVKADWLLYKRIAIAIAALAYFFAIIQALTGYNRVEQIKAETLHGAERYTPKPWYWLAAWGVVAVGLVVGGIYVGSTLW